MQFQHFAKLVALSHSVFALPFALAAFVLAERANEQAGEGISTGAIIFKLALVCIAVVCARTAAMSMNRLLDRKIDAENPRTQNRELVRGVMTPKQVAGIAFLSTSGFLLAAYALGKHCLVLAPFVLVILVGYSVTKRFTQLSHFSLGLALALAPGGAWWVLRPTVELTPLVLMAAVTVWVAGFDILYACQDIEFDRRRGLYSIPAKHGSEAALRIAFFLHIVAVLLFGAVGITAHLESIYFSLLSLLALPLLGQHFLLRPWDLRRINHAFFTANGVVSICYLVIVCVSVTRLGS